VEILTHCQIDNRLYLKFRCICVELIKHLKIFIFCKNNIISSLLVNNKYVGFLHSVICLLLILSAVLKCIRNLQLAMSIMVRRTTFAAMAARGSLQRGLVSIQSESGTTGKAPHFLQNLVSGATHPKQSEQRDVQLSSSFPSSLGGGK
jgi:hypothetical protein